MLCICMNHFTNPLKLKCHERRRVGQLHMAGLPDLLGSPGPELTGARTHQGPSLPGRPKGGPPARGIAKTGFRTTGKQCAFGAQEGFSRLNIWLWSS
jgi:hypothetical protein